jgi:hypothetical protein
MTEEATPEQIATAIHLVAESIARLKDSNVFTEETIELANKVAQTFLTKVEEKLETVSFVKEEPTQPTE